MSITFKFEPIESTASPLYLATATDENGKVVMQRQIACEDESELEGLAQYAYEDMINPKTNY
jgi:hypothetical protein